MNPEQHDSEAADTPLAPPDQAPAPAIEPQAALPRFEKNRDLLWFMLVLLVQNKKWWLIPMWFLLALLGLFVSLTGNTSILPAIYALF